MAADTLTVTLHGGGPWGFRLFGGGDDPLIVAKLRKRSKAHDGGLQEGDVLLGLNNYSTHNIPHNTAMDLVDNAGQSLTIHLLRGSTDPNVISAAFQELGSQLQPAPASAQTQQQQPRGPPVATSQFPTSTLTPFQTSAQQSQGQTHLMHGGGPVVNGMGPSHTTQERHSYTEGDTTTHVNRETTTQQFGGTTLTKVTTEKVSHTGGRFNPSPSPSFAPKPFQINNPGGAPKPGVWQPSGGQNRPAVPQNTVMHTSGLTVSAPKGVGIQSNPDQSFTMTIGLGVDDSKENIAPSPSFQASNVPPPPPMFKVMKVQDRKDVWQPTSVPPPPRPQPPPEPEPEQEMDFRPPVEPWPPSMDDAPALAPEVKVFDLTRILKGDMSGDDSNPDSPGGIMRRKKMFADSAFYDDPEHKYPTIEEQIKMAKKVALSLMAPQNRNARGHNMFMKRRQKADRWVAGMMEQPIEFDSDREDEKYYRPEPWMNQHTWSPAKPTGGYRPYDMSNIKTGPSSTWKMPVLPTGPDKEEKAKALSAEEFERLRLYESKTTHNQVSPQMCFSLADDLRNMKGRGGKLFAKRRAKAETWVVDEAPPSAPNPNMLAKILQDSPAPPPDRTDSAVPAMGSGGGGPRLQAMLEMPKQACTPWEAAIETEGRSIEKAFAHLDQVQVKRQKPANALASNLAFKQATGGTSSGTPSWAPPSGAAASPAPSAGSASSAPNYNRSMKPWNPAGGAAPSGQSAGFRPVSFTAPVGGGGSGAASSWQPSPAPTGLSEGEGFCDL